jgi:flagellin
MSDVTLTAGIRDTLLALQNTSTDLTTTQEDLATGKKVNTAFDNPSSYFTAQTLTYRANDLSALLDQIGQGQQTLTAASNGLTGLNNLLEQALSLAQQAQQAPEPTATTFGAVNITGGLPTSETIGSTTGSGGFAGGTLGTNGVLTIDVNVNGAAVTPITVALVPTDTATTVAAKINQASSGGTNGNVTASVSATGQLVLTANDANVGFTVVDGGAGSASRAAGLTTVANTVVNSNDLFQISGGGTLVLGADGGATQTITIGTAAGDVSTVKELNAALQNLNIPNLTASLSENTASFSVTAATTQNNLTINGTGGVPAALGLIASATPILGATIPGTPDASRATLQTDYNALLTQMDQLAGDSSYNGINLLNGSNLTILFNELGTSSLNIQGVTFNSAGLGLTPVTSVGATTGFQSDATISTTISAVNAALSSVRAQTETFGNNASTIQVRQSFEQAMINTLQTGSSNLVLADNNQESADLLTEQTQQQLEISSLSIANQANQSVLKLFP